MNNPILHLIMHYGYIGIFMSIALGIVGLPIPDEVLMTFAGFMVFKGHLSLVFVILSGFSGAIVGTTTNYLLGYRFGLPLLKKFGPKIHISQERIDFTHALFSKYGAFFLMIGYFIPGVRHITAYLAGISYLSYRKFALYAYSGALIWCTIFVFLGKTLGRQWVKVEHYMHHASLYALLGLAVVLIIVFFFVKRKNKSA